MPDKLPRLTAKEAEKLLLANGFQMSRQKGSYRIYRKEGNRMVIPHHQGKTLHPKIVKELLALLD
ncbi:MAG: addiction module toxin, HicA family [Candidatus Electrothrix sp. AUS4]|nr:addiction module toxin, HicA family [Candidatus Electrothrix sp. AUS4]